MKAINIQWDTDGEAVELPPEIDLPGGMTDEDEISDYITEQTGWCHKGFMLSGAESQETHREKPKYTIEDFVQIGPVAAKAAGDMKAISWSSPQSKLIKLAAKYCDAYASDIIYTIMEIEEKLKAGTMKTSSYLFGFRSTGVDENRMILAKCNASPEFGWDIGKEYLAFWKLDVDVYQFGFTKDWTKMSMYEVTLPEKTGISTKE